MNGCEGRIANALFERQEALLQDLDGFPTIELQYRDIHGVGRRTRIRELDLLPSWL